MRTANRGTEVALPAVGTTQRLRYRLKRLWMRWAFSTLGARSLGLVRWWLANGLGSLAPRAGFRFACAAYQSLLRGGQEAGTTELLERIESSLAARCRRGEALRAASPGTIVLPEEEVDLTGLVLKPPRLEGGLVVERGVLLLKNNARITAFRVRPEAPRILSRYDLVLEPSWSGYANPDLLAFATLGRPVLIMASCREDYVFLQRLGLDLHPIDLGAGDWVDPRIFHPLPGVEKDFDAVVVARWTYTKRLWVLLAALKAMADPTFRVALVAMNIPQDTDRSPLLAELARSGVATQVEVFEDLTPEEVNSVLNRSRVGLLLSLQEGSNRALFEGFFAGVPGLALRRNLGIARGHLNPETGLLVEEKNLAATLVGRRHRWGELDPRRWALRNITPEISTAKLNRALRESAESRGERWTTDIVAKVNVPELRYYPDESVGHGLETMRELLGQP